MANERGYNLILCNTDDNLEKEESYIDMLEEKMVDGIIFTASSQRKDKLDRLSKVSVPVITVDREVVGLATQGKILVDNVKGAYDAVNYLIESGYEQIVHVTGPMSSKPARDRLEGLKKALEENGLIFNEATVYSGEFKSEWGYDAVKQIMQKKLK